MNSQAFVSVVLPTYNGSATVAKAIESVMSQTYRNFELVVIDDGSSDETPEILKGLSRRYQKLVILTQKENMGYVKALNDGIKAAQGLYIARIDDDDVWEDEQKLEKQVSFLEEHSDYGLVGGGIIHVEDQGKEMGRYMFPERDEDIRKVILADNAFAHSAVVFRKDLAERVGGYREEFHFFADWALWLALGSISKLYNFPEYFTLYLDKEHGGDYGMRNTQIRRKIRANLQLAFKYRRHYPEFWKALLLAFAKYAYSYIPFRYRIRSFLNALRVFLIGSPGYTVIRKRKEKEPSKPICIMGTGYVGLVTGLCFAELGNQVLCVDPDGEKIKSLKNGVPPFYEPGLKELLGRNLSGGRIRFTTDIKEGVQACDILFICVGTPQLSNGKADLSQVEEVARNIGTYALSDKIVIEKSTVPVNTNMRLRELLEQSRINESVRFSVVSNPEFLRQGSAINDFLHPDRIVLGFERGESYKDRVLSLYEGIDAPKIATDIASAELIKHASNTFLALKISFINLISRICEKTGADVKEVAWGMGLDKRIGHLFLEAGIGYGGSCFPKDVRAFQDILQTKGIHQALLQAVEEINETQKEMFAERVKEELQGIQGKTIAVLGLSFKPNTDDMRESPSISIIKKLLQEGAGRIKAYDPRAMKNARHVFQENIEYSQTPYEAAQGSDCLIICTEWNEFKDLDLEKIRALLRKPLVIDGRNTLDPHRMRELGFRYIGVGRTQ